MEFLVGLLMSCICLAAFTVILVSLVNIFMHDFKLTFPELYKEQSALVEHSLGTFTFAAMFIGMIFGVFVVNFYPKITSYILSLF
jgi:hypothetical protein